jgi:hypothetical protein
MQVNMTLLADLTARVSMFHTISISHLATSLGTVGNPSTDMRPLSPTRWSSIPNGLHCALTLQGLKAMLFIKLRGFLKKSSYVRKN